MLLDVEHLARSLISRMPPGLKGALWMVAASAGGGAMLAFVRLASHDIHPLEIAFFRNFFAVFLVLPLHATLGSWRLPRAHMKRHSARALLTAGAMICYFWAAAIAPVALVTAISFTAPILATAGAAFLLSEKVGLSRWVAVMVGFAGVLVIIRPGPEGITAGALLALASTFFAAGDWLVLKPLTRDVPTRTVVTWLTVLLTPLTLLPALFVWKMPEPLTVLWLVGLAASATFAQVAATRSFALADVSLVSAFIYTQLIFAAAIGWWLFGEVIDGWTLVGAAVIVVSGAYIAKRDRDIKVVETVMK